MNSPVRMLAALTLLACPLPALAQKSKPQAAPAGVPPGLDRYVDSVMKAFGVPGLSLTIVKDGKVVLARGYGVRRLGEPAPVDAETLFGIASNTKVFTAVALGLLVEQGKIDWDTPVVTYLPWFQMYDSWVTRQITVRDLLVHRSGLGLGAGDLLWWPESNYTRRQIAERLKFIKPATSFRYDYAYDNVLYVVASELIEAMSGQSWEDFITSNILVPAGMTTSLANYPAPGQRGNVAATHAPVDGTLQTVPPDTSVAKNPAGGIMTNAQDEAKWLMIMADSGRLSDGKALYSIRTARALWTPVTILPNNPPPPALAPLRSNFRGYALGLGMSDYRGYKIAQHTGGLPGYVSEVTTVPDLKLGVAVLTNAESGPAFRAITLHVLDFYMGARFDWLGAWKWAQARRDSLNAAANQESSSTRNADSKPSLPLTKYAGTYRDEWYGDVVITESNGQLGIRFAHSPSLTGPLEHWQYDTFVARWSDRSLRADAYVTFTLDPDGKVASVKMLPASPEVDFSFDFQDLDLKPVTGN